MRAPKCLLHQALRKMKVFETKKLWTNVTKKEKKCYHALIGFYSNEMRFNVQEEEESWVPIVLEKPPGNQTIF